MKLDIRKKVLLLVLSGILLTFLLLALFFTVGLYNASKTLNSEADALSSSASEYAEELVEKQIQKHMEEITLVRAQDMNREMVEAAEDTKYLANNMNNLLKKGAGSGAGSLPNALFLQVNLIFITARPLYGRGFHRLCRKKLILNRKSPTPLYK